MVNGEAATTKSRLLSRLRELRGVPTSGESLAEELGVSRVSVWKAASALKEAGYALESGDSGYRLDHAEVDDFLYPWEFGVRERLFRYFKETSSTMDRARELSDRGAAAGTVVVAERQSAGRGRAGRTWDSDQGGLFFTLILPARTSVLRCARVALASQLAVVSAVRKTAGVEARARWPNDVYAGGSKIAGVLVDFEAEGDLTRRLAVGIGVNVNNSPSGARKTSCAALSRRHVSRQALLLAFLDDFARENALTGGELLFRWKAAAEGIGARVAVVLGSHGDAPVERSLVRDAGRLRGIDEFGRAIVETSNGISRLDAGTDSLRF